MLRSSSARLRPIKGTERCERRRAAIRALQQAVERFADATATKCFPSSRCASAIQIIRPQESTAETQPQLQPALRIVDHLRRRLARFKLGAHFLDLRRKELRAPLVCFRGRVLASPLTPQAISLPRTPLIKPSSSLRRQAHRLFLSARQLSQASSFPSVSLLIGSGISG